MNVKLLYGTTPCSSIVRPCFLARRDHPVRTFVPVAWIFFGTFTFFIFLSVASAAAGPVRSVQNVLEIKDVCAACITSLRPMIADIGNPLLIALLKTAMSGLTL